MFFVTGDVHGNIKDLESRKFGHIKKSDFVVVCGDLGLIWSGSKEEEKILKKLGRKRHGVLFVDGAHENFELLANYPVTEWNGGKVQVISGNLIHLMRGQVYNINGKKVFTFGGGESTDREMRTPHESWWETELPGMEEMQEGVQNLVANNWEVDYIFTHEAPTTLRKFIDGDDFDINPLNVYLECIHKKCKFKKWAFGNYHVNRRMSTIYEAVFDGVIKLE